MNYEEQILELKKRIEMLEKAEKKRIIKRKYEIAFKLAKTLLAVIVLVVACYYIYNNYVKPYKEKIDDFGHKIDLVEDFVADKWESIQNFIPFS